MTRDSRRSEFYAAEAQVRNLLDRATRGTHTVQIAGAELTVQSDAKFASLESIRSYLDAVLASASVRERFTRAAEPVTVRARRSAAAAHYRSDLAEIAVPVGADGRWALRELVILHELAHHLDDSAGPAHGPAFAHTLIDLVGLVLGAELALVYRVVLSDAGLCG